MSNQNGLQQETTDVLARLVRFNTVNPPGNERPAIEYLANYLREAGFEVELLASVESRPNLVANLRGAQDGPVLCFLGHVDTVVADPSEWRHDPWSGDLADGFLWGRGSIDMKSQVAAEAVAAANLARDGWRPAAGALKLVFVSDEEKGGDCGAAWVTDAHPGKVRCDMLLNEGGGECFELAGRRLYGLGCAEKGVFRFRVTVHGEAGHASMPRAGDNALPKLAPVLERLAAAQITYDVTEIPAALLSALGGDPTDPRPVLDRLAAENPKLLTLFEPMFGVTMTPTVAHASDAVNVIPSRASVIVDCRVPPGLGEDAPQRLIDELFDRNRRDLTIEFTEKTPGNASPPHGRLVDVISAWVERNDPGAQTVPVVLPGFSDSRWFRAAFPDCQAYGFFPQRHQSLLETMPLVHNADERIDVRDLGFAAGFYADVAREVLQSPTGA
jgi:acetylornithine deacetylase/succinyl-diaminopimelate desuccinylase-like protein